MKNLSNFKKLQVSTYARLAGSFDSHQKRENRNHLNKIKAIASFLDISPGDRVLEIGVGTGIHAYHLLNGSPSNVFYYGIDLSEDMLKEARKKLVNFKHVDLRAMDGENLLFGNNFFDKVFISGSLHHFENPGKGISEIIRVLKKGGKFCIMEPNYIFPKNFLAANYLPEEKNMKFMRKYLLHRWLRNKEVSYKMENFAYTPPFPKSFVRFYDVLDAFIKKTPFVRSLSVMIFIKGVKGNEDSQI